MAFEVEFLHEVLDEAADVVAVEIDEPVSGLFDISLVFLAPFADLDFSAWLWTEGTIVLGDPVNRPDELRRFAGIVEEIVYLEPVGHAFAFRARLRPLIHALAYRVRSRIFQGKSVIDISKQICKDAGIPEDHVAWPETDFEPREYCVQWKESELDFLRRLWEDEGLFFWYEFSPDEGKPKLRLTDQQSDFQPITGVPALPLTRNATAEIAGDWLFGARLEASQTYDGFLSRTWDFKAPSKPRSFKAAASDKPIFEKYEYPFGLSSQANGDARAKRRLELATSRGMVLTASSSASRLAPGRIFAIEGASLNGMPEAYALVRVRHRFRAASEGGGSYRVDLEALPADTTFRPRLMTRKPKAPTTESAVVVGPPGEEIHVDPFGRIKVHFYWDREGKIDEHASCWIRVQQQNTSGSLVLPRIGWEVEVGFIDADPDQPVVLQKLYNRETMPPYGLPASLHVSSLQSASSPGGGGTNEIRMSDGSGGMEFFVHAQKDFRMVAGNDLDEKVGVDAHLDVKVDANVTVVGTETINVGSNQTMSVTGAMTMETNGSKTVSVAATDDLGVKALATVATTGARTETVGGLLNVLATKVADQFDAGHRKMVGAALCLNAAGPISDGSKSKIETVGGAKMEIIRGAKQETIKAAKIFTAADVSLSSGKDMGVVGTSALAFTVGGPVVVQANGDVALTGDTVRITVGKATLKAGASIAASPASITVKAGSISAGGKDVMLKSSIEYK